MTLSILAFWCLAVALVGSALAVVLTRNLFHSVLWLALALTSTAGLFLTLDAEFLAAVQLLLYAGGLITIVVFAIVVTKRMVGERIAHTSRRIGGGLVVAAALFAALFRVIRTAPVSAIRPPMPGDITKLMGDAILTRYSLAFELLAVLLLTALVSAIYFARPED
ncbi:MAG: NADH-quinone oxidoreductase subunit J [Vicinamibacterales bacterium]